VLWWSLALFYACVAVTVGCLLFAVPFQFFGAGVCATFGAYIGAMHARTIYEGSQAGQPIQEQPKFYDPRDTQR
jgi:hypothetical protein